MLPKFFLRIRHEQAIAVKGYAEKDAVSDFGRFSCTFRARGTNLQEAYLALQNSRDAVRKYLREQKFADTEIVVTTIQTEKIARRDAQGNGLVAGIQVVKPGTQEPNSELALKINVACFQRGLLMFAPVGIGGRVPENRSALDHQGRRSARINPGF